MKANDSQVQPNTGWDTLNWSAPVRALEWGGEESSGRSWSDFSKPFYSGLNVPRNSANSIKLNWNAKLVPVGKEKIKKALYAPEVGDFFEGQAGPSLLPNPDFIRH